MCWVFVASRAFSSCGERASLVVGSRHASLVALRHVGSSQTRAQTRFPFIGRRILNHCATREALPVHTLVSADLVLPKWFSGLSRLDPGKLLPRGCLTHCLDPHNQSPRSQANTKSSLEYSEMREGFKPYTRLLLSQSY